jgi:hypothetical protein
VAARIRPGVSQAPPLARSQARTPEAAPTVTDAVATHCMHMPPSLAPGTDREQTAAYWFACESR